MKKRILSLFLCLVITVSVLPTTLLAASKRDTSDQEILAADLKALGLFKGVSDTDFDLDREPTRLEALIMLIRLLGKEDEALSKARTHPFTDVPQWADQYVGYAYQSGLTNGISANQFGMGNATCANYLTFVLRALGYSDTDGKDFTWDDPFTLAKQAGILPGCVNTQNFWRADVATVSYLSLSARLNGSSQTLSDKLISTGVFTRDAFNQIAVSEKTSAILSGSDLQAASSFAIHFLDVGEGDSSLILCDGHAMLIDGGTSENSSKIYSYLKTQGITYLDYVVCTHPHADHAGGLSGALNYAKVGTALSPVATSDNASFNNFEKYLTHQGVQITVPASGSTYSLGSATFRILGPLSSSENINDESLVLRVEYGSTSFLFAADAERDEELSILQSKTELRSTVLKVGHHGSSSSTSYVFLREIQPEYAVISVGADNAYGHPTEDVLSRLRDADVTTYRTDLQGTVICTSDGKKVSFSVEQNPDADTLSAQPAGTIPSSSTASDSEYDCDYILNVNTMKFHYPSCSSVEQMSEKNKRLYNGTREQLISEGYSPCSRCKP